MSTRNDRPSYVKAIIATSEKKLIEANINNAKKEIEWFLEQAFKFSLTEIKLNSDLQLNNQQIDIFNIFINRRIKGEPFQYILKESSFYGYSFIVNSSTLIPRPESEKIISIAKKSGPYDNALDIGTGSGNLAITLSLEKIINHVDAIDISEEALKTARQNIIKHNLKNVHLFQGDMLKGLFHKQYDLIVCNPPYISKEDYLNLDDHIKLYEPKAALTDNQDGLLFYHYLSKNLMNILSPKGKIILEIGKNKTKPIIEKLFQKNKFQFKWHKDLNHDYRVIELYK